MKKIFTLICALAGFASMSSAASVDDLVPLKHSYVLVGDDYTNNGTEKIAKGALFGDDHFFTPTGHDKATNKGSVDLSVVDELGIVTEEIVNKYAEYGKHLNSLRLKAAQDVFAMRVTAGSKVIIFFEKNKETDNRYPIVAEDAKMENKLTSADNVIIKGAYGGKQVGRFEWTADDDRLVYVGAENQIFLSYVIIEANEQPGTPAVKVGPQAFENGLWFKEVTCTPREAYGTTTDVYYTTDGSTPTATSEKYTAPIKCYKEMTVKFQAYVMGMAVPDAENEANVNFSFDAPEIAADGVSFTITTPYAEQNGTNYYTLNGGEEVKGDGATLTESATVSAYTKIVNGDYATFTSKKSSKDVYVLNPIKEKKTIQVIAGDVVLDEEATATSTTGEVYTVENGEISADKMDFFVKNLTFKALTDEQYQVPAGNERYIQMSNTNITFLVAAGETVKVKVVCSKNSCKNIDAEDAEDGSPVTDRMCYVNVSGTNYGGEDLKLNPDGNVIEFELKGGKDVSTTDEEGNTVTTFNPADTYYTFQKYSGTGNILISSIEIAPAAENPQELETADFADGKYYLVNVSTNKAWGCANSWGTQGSLVKHPEYVILHKQENGTYFMETQASNGGEQYYFNGEWMDNGTPAALNIIKGEELGEDMDGNPVYVYYITVDTLNYYGWDGTENTVLARNLPAGDEKAMWVIASHEQAVAGLAEATEEDPMDATFLILDPNFNRNNRN
ncbi:MAG: chitobiase/beta-hexosaminidase C-terminal domain-containing protein, partial [Prevotella sp.]|nr:chitobiase/beta-hexosaminidase C-terminal domain-containing protein [Prevotella sp.]